MFEKELGQAVLDQKAFKAQQLAFLKSRAFMLRLTDPELSACAIADRLGLPRQKVMKWFRETETVQ